MFHLCINVHTNHYSILSFYGGFYGGFYRSSTALVDVPAVQFTFFSTRVRSWTPLRPHECVMSKEECSYNKALYCSSAFASVHHTDDYVWTISEEPQWVRALAPRFWTFNVLSDFSKADANRKDFFPHYKNSEWLSFCGFFFFCTNSFFLTTIARFHCIIGSSV